MNFASLIVVAELDNFVGAFIQQFLVSYKDVYTIEMPKDRNYSTRNQKILLFLILYSFDFYIYFH